MYFFNRAYIPDGRIYLGNVKYALQMISDYAYAGSIGTTLDILLEHQPQLRTYYYQYAFSGPRVFVTNMSIMAGNIR